MEAFNFGNLEWKLAQPLLLEIVQQDYPDPAGEVLIQVTGMYPKNVSELSDSIE